MCVRLSPQQLDSIYDSLIKEVLPDLNGFKIIPTKDEICSNTDSAKSVHLDYTWIRPLDIRKCIQMGIIKDRLSLGSIRHTYRLGVGSSPHITPLTHYDLLIEKSYIRTFQLKKDNSLISFTIHEFCAVFDEMIYPIGYLESPLELDEEVYRSIIHQCVVEGYVYLLGRAKIEKTNGLIYV